MSGQEDAIRVSRNAFTNLAISMIGFGILIGLAFPFAVRAVGVPDSIAMTSWFFGFTASAGILVGGLNIVLARLLVRPRLRLMAERMSEVEEGLRIATYTGDWSNCDPDECSLPVESEDEFGAAASAFNGLLEALAESHKVEGRLADFTHAMSADLDVSAICEAAIDFFRRDLGAAGVAIIGGSDGEMEVLASHGLTNPGSLVGSDLVRRAIVSLDADSMSMPEHLVIDTAVATLVPRHVWVYPLVLESAAIGAVVLASSDEVPPSAQALGPVLVRTLGVGLANALSHESIRRLADLDGLTGILNRRAGLDRLERVFGNAQRTSTPVGVVMIDIDHFKAINDEYGHLVGDDVLAGVARAIRQNLRERDFVVRYGGEEFLAVLVNAPEGDVDGIAERIRRAAEQHRVDVDGVDVSVTVSVGSASTENLTVDSETTLVRRADEALYAAKRAGRNRVVSAA